MKCLGIGVDVGGGISYEGLLVCGWAVEEEDVIGRGTAVAVDGARD